MDLHNLLNQFHPVTNEDYTLLRDVFKERSFKKGEFITVPGQVQSELYFVKTGFQMAYIDSENKSHVMAFMYAPGLCAIPTSFFFQTPSRAYLQCLSDSEMDYIRFDDLQILFDRSQGIERLFRKIAEALMVGFLNRYIELKTMTIEDRYKLFCQRSPYLLHIVAHKHIASYLGMDATNFSKLFNSVQF
jgi:CRP-like cAMP-binding protein